MLKINDDYYKQAQTLFEQANELVLTPAPSPQQLQTLRAKIDTLFEKVHKAQDVDQVTVQLLMRARNVTILNTDEPPIIGKKSSDHLYINTFCPRISPTIRNSAYRNLQLPVVSTYHHIANYLAAYRLAPTCLPLVPDSLKKAVGKLDGKVVDLFSVTLDTRYVSRVFSQSRPFNLNAHHWAHADILPGNDVTRKFPMGLFPIWGVSNAQGVTKHKHPKPIAIDTLESLQVHSHPKKKGSQEHTDMLYSPDDAHFMIDPTPPFSVTWAAVLDDDKRVLIARLMMIHDFEDPFMKAFIRASKNCRHLDQHLTSLKTGFEQTAEALFKRLTTALEGTDREAALKLFDALPVWHKNNIYKHASLIKVPPKDAPAHFGKLAFLNDEQIASTHHLSKNEQLLSLQRHIAELFHLLSEDMAGLVNTSHDIQRQFPKDVDTLVSLARKFEEDDPSALEDFASLKDELKNKVFKAVWRLNGRPHKDFGQYGKKQFHASNHKECAKALYLAATSLPFATPKVPTKIKLEQLTIEPVEEKEGKTPAKKKKTEQERPSTPSSSSPKAKLSTVLQALDALLPLNNEEKSKQLHALFDQLSIDKETVKYSIYKDLGRLAGKKQEKDALDYGRAHFGHNIDHLREALLKRGASA